MAEKDVRKVWTPWAWMPFSIRIERNWNDMANKLKNYKPKKRPGPPKVYDFRKWLDGQWWRLVHGKDFNCSIDSMADQVRRNFKKLGWVAEVHKEEDAIVIRRKAKVPPKKKKSGK